MTDSCLDSMWVFVYTCLKGFRKYFQCFPTCISHSGQKQRSKDETSRPEYIHASLFLVKQGRQACLFICCFVPVRPLVRFFTNRAVGLPPAAVLDGLKTIYEQKDLVYLSCTHGTDAWIISGLLVSYLVTHLFCYI